MCPVSRLHNAANRPPHGTAHFAYDTTLLILLHEPEHICHKNDKSGPLLAARYPMLVVIAIKRVYVNVGPQVCFLS